MHELYFNNFLTDKAELLQYLHGYLDSSLTKVFKPIHKHTLTERYLAMEFVIYIYIYIK